MKYEILNKGSFSSLKVDLEQGETFKAESGAMVTMSKTLDIDGKLDGGVGKALLRSLLTNEKLFFQKITASRGSGEILFAPGMLGDLIDIPMNGQEYIIQKDGYFASSTGIEVSTKAQSLSKGLFSKEGFFVMRASGFGTLFVSSFGNIHEIELQKGEEIIIDNGHLVAWDADMKYEIRMASNGILGAVTTGEGLVTEFVGPGKVFIQSRNPSIMITTSA